ncbi:MAG: redoxin domain-containing protein [Nanoarchaeota archaeon]|nr:redoxin domain-containing protein [Nanoarchaeota archaeon]
MNNNKSSSVITIVITTVVVFALAYFLFKSSPDNPQQNQNSNNANVDNMHGGSAMATNSDLLNSLIGKPMPEIELSDKDGKVYTVADLKGKNIVLFFNEGLMCYPACWNQIASFGSDERFNSEQIQAISIVVDSSEDWKTAIAKMPQLAKATTMFDTGANASRQLGVLTTASSMHRGALPGHTYIVLDKNAVVRYVFDDPNMAIANDMLFDKIGGLN